MIMVMFRRLFAALIDYGVFLLFLVAYFILFGQTRSDGLIEISGFHHLAAIVFVWVLLFPIMEAWFGYTLGKGLFDLRVTTLDGKKVNFKRAFKRHLMDPIDFALCFLLVVPIIRRSESPRRLGDMWAKTTVIRDT